MGQKITEKEVADVLLDTAHVLVTQPVEDEDGNKIESLRRIPLGIFFADLAGDIADLKYDAITINSFTNTGGTVELGTALETVTLNWKTSKTPTALTLNGTALAPDATTYTTEALVDTKTWTLTATDERGATASKSTTVYFYNGVYYGVLEDGAVLDSAAILGLSKKLQSGKTLTFEEGAGASQRIAYALPSRYGTPNFNVGGFDGGFTMAATVEFTNASGYTESYDVWLSDNTALGNTTVKVT